MAKSNLDRTIETLGILTHEELLELREVLDTLLTKVFSIPRRQRLRAVVLRAPKARVYTERRIVVKTLADGTVKAYGPFSVPAALERRQIDHKYLGKAKNITDEEKERMKRLVARAKKNSQAQVKGI